MLSTGRFLLPIVALVLIVSGAHATTHEFYKGKTMRIIVGFAAGGGFDTHSRAIARHMGKHIPGNPTIIVENMAGAGSLISANHLYKVAKPDGLVIGNFIGSLFLDQVLARRGIEFDARKFEYVGIPLQDTPVCLLSKAAGITSVKEWAASKTPVKMGGLGTGTPQDNIPKILGATLALPIHLVSGYKGTSDVRLAIEAGEVAGACLSWDSVKATWRKMLEVGDVVVVMQFARQAHSELQNVPVAIDLAQNEEARQLIEVGAVDPGAINRPYVLPPGTPKERVQLLRKAFLETMKDAEFLAEARKAKLDIEPMSGEEVERVIAKLFKLSPAMVTKLKELLK